MILRGIIEHHVIDEFESFKGDTHFIYPVIRKMPTQLEEIGNPVIGDVGVFERLLQTYFDPSSKVKSWTK